MPDLRIRTLSDKIVVVQQERLDRAINAVWSCLLECYPTTSPEDKARVAALNDAHLIVGSAVWGDIKKVEPAELGSPSVDGCSKTVCPYTANADCYDCPYNTSDHKKPAWNGAHDINYSL